jgi:hypothetical protein
MTNALAPTKRLKPGERFELQASFNSALPEGRYVTAVFTRGTSEISASSRPVESAHQRDVSLMGSIPADASVGRYEITRLQSVKYAPGASGDPVDIAVRGMPAIEVAYPQVAPPPLTLVSIT